MNPAARLHRLRWRLALALAVVAAVGLAALALTATLVDDGLRQDRFAEQQQGLASRAAALVFFDTDTGLWSVESVVDDMVSAESDVLVVVTRDGNQEVFRQGPPLDVGSFATRGFADAAEQGVTGNVTSAGDTFAVAAAPFFEGDRVEGAVVVGARPGADADHQRLVIFVWSMAAALTAISAAAGWLIAGRALKPMGESLERESRFLATAAHELRTPMARARAVAESALLTASDLPASAQRATLLPELRRLVSLTRDGSAEVNDLLLVGRIDAEQLGQRVEPVRLDTLVAGFEATVAELAVATSGPVEITADPALLRHAIANLFANAQRHGRVQGRPLLIQASVESDDHGAWITISDDGPGFGTANVDQLFERHHTNGGGSGLGLWIARHIVEQSGGTISATADPGTGATFTLRWSD